MEFEGSQFKLYIASVSSVLFLKKMKHKAALLKSFLPYIILLTLVVFFNPGKTQTLLHVSENKRYLVDSEGNPFLWLGDTAWGLFHRTTRETAETYLSIRKDQGFTIIQASILAAGYWQGLDANLYGDQPLKYNNPLSPNESFFKHVDWVIRKAEENGLYIGLLPVWGEYVCPAWHDGPKIFDASTAYAYGKWVGARYAGTPNIVWILGGDRAADQCGKDDINIWHQMAKGIKESDPNHLITYHPNGYTSSSEWFHFDPLFDFNMIETHKFTQQYYRRILADYHKNMPKPLIQGEPAYEDEVLYHLPDRMFRSQPYWSFLAGAKGHNYGKTYIAYLTDENHPHDWREWESLADSLDSPGLRWLQIFKENFSDLPWWDLIPENDLIIGYPGEGNNFMAAAHTPDFSNQVVYFPQNTPGEIRIPHKEGENIKAHWINPVDGEKIPIDLSNVQDTHLFTPPEHFKDGLLIIKNE